MRSRDDVHSRNLNDRVRDGRGGHVHRYSGRDVHHDYAHGDRAHKSNVHRGYARDGRVHDDHVHGGRGVHAHKSSAHGGHVCDDRDHVRDGRARAYGNLFLHGRARKSSAHRAYARDDRVRDDHDVLHDCAHACVRFLFYNPFTCPP